ncbi:hypothetical protein MMC31_003627 [Peltigera leucophlebia]|nr:hypothetical protein [Peltigera leucophlebia]
MAQNPFRKSQLVEYKNTVAGHDGVLSDQSGSTVFKPCKETEIHFYESAAAHPAFAVYIPKFMGTLSLGTDPSLAAATAAAVALGQSSNPDQLPIVDQISETVLKEDVWSPSGGGKIKTETAIVLENVADHYTKPNILDVKLGAQLWADDAPPAKREKLDRVANETTSKALGIRIAGMRIWEGTETLQESDPALIDGYRVYNKEYGRGLTPETIGTGFETYFQIKKGDGPSKRIKEIIKLFIRDLEGLQHVLESEESRMYSSSLLFVYEGDDTALQEVHKSTTSPFLTVAPQEGFSSEDSDDFPNVAPIQAMKLIDFAHAEWTPGQGPDRNVLHGIKSVIRILEEIL